MRRSLLPVLLFVVACGSDERVPVVPVDARGPDDYTFVVNDLDLPASPTEAMALAINLDDAGAVDNELGRVLEAVLALPGARDLETVLDARIRRGEHILLVNVDADNLVNSRGVGFFVFTGSNPRPPACLDGFDEVCGRHLDGAATFEVTDAEHNRVAGAIISARYAGSAAELTIPLGTIDGVPITLPLRQARVLLADVGSTSWERGLIGGAIAAADVDAVLVPWLAAVSDADVASVRAAVQGVPLDLDLDEDGVDDALSVGFGITAVPAWFTPVR